VVDIALLKGLDHPSSNGCSTGILRIRRGSRPVAPTLTRECGTWCSRCSADQNSLRTDA
jgi:hypothetical protein